MNLELQERVNKYILFPFELAVLVSAIVLVEVGTRAHKLFGRRFDEDLPR